MFSVHSDLRMFLLHAKPCKYVVSTFRSKLTVPFFMEDLKGGGRWFLRNAGVHLPNYMAIIPVETIHEYTIVRTSNPSSSLA